ncbi:MAG: WD40/YVTN/BNR-like repeat-containing protein [Actinomycetota bacterium]
MLLAGTRAGVHIVDEDRTMDVGGPVSSLASHGRLWAVAGDHRVVASDDGLGWEGVATIPDLSVRCLLPGEGETLAGTSESHLYRVRAGEAFRIEGFEEVEGRDGWYTPWGGPPDTRSLAVAEDGAVYANVHVGGIPRSRDGGDTWTPTIDVDADVHQVIARGNLVLAACAQGLAVSADGGESWRIDADGLHGRYCRAVAATPGTLLVSASTGPFSKQAAVYRRPLRSPRAFERCGDGLPEWFGSNVDSHCLATEGERVALGTGGGDVWVSEDLGASWDLAAKGLPGVTCLAFAPVAW